MTALFRVKNELVIYRIGAIEIEDVSDQEELRLMGRNLLRTRQKLFGAR